MTPSIETRRSWVVATLSLVALAFSFGAIWIAVVALKSMAAELGGARSVPALATALAWFGSGFGGIGMGLFADRFGVRWTVMIGSVMIAIGLMLSSFGHIWQVYLGHGLFIGLLGNSGLNAPLNVYVSRWFDRRRGSALALIASGQYIAGAIWPPIFDYAIGAIGWRATMFWFAIAEMLVLVPIAIFVLTRPPEVVAPAAAVTSAEKPKVFGWPPNLVFAMLALGAFFCCVPMSMPQAHLVALCSDLGITPTHGAVMLSLLLGTAFLARQMWGAVSDRIGGLFTLLIGSIWQFLAIAGFIYTQNEAGLFTVTAVFGMGFSGLVPAYVLVSRELFAAREAGWRVPILLCMSGFGMASGGWFAGMLYDHFGYYAPAFAAGLMFNFVHLCLIGTLVIKRTGWFDGARTAPAYG